MPHILSAQNLEKSFHLKTVVKNISFEVKSGQIVGLLGPNGAGKTTAFYMALGLISADKGKIFLDDKDITHLPIHTRAKLGISYLPQEASIFRKLNVADNIMAILELRNDLSQKQRHEKLETLLEEFHISHLRRNLGISLSGGERRRTEIARTLATDPKFILLDEPFAGIDPISVIDIKHIIKHLCQRGIGILITDHNVRETLDTCEFAYIANEGNIICSGGPDEILANKQVRDVYLGDDFSL
ncbi:MAG: LPS export ABC transporter ATP-binding protein [Gammaproteobacteria bacterium RIFCSPHIGHO2_12_FULL_35_23]|nr:MAG: LPS export ABC transporter ATP-binding protein [Gammaproteobacteria bacterium RIFCSPHIGHO2_12_FULL_35_23]